MISFKRRFALLSVIVGCIVLVTAWAGSLLLPKEHGVIVGSLATLSVVFVLGIYIFVNQTLLTPLSTFPKALKILSNGEEMEKLSQQQKFSELHALVDAFVDLSKQVKQSHAELKHQSMHDDLTGLPNRTLLLDRLKQLIKDSIRNSITPGVIILDLERLKEINNTLGHRLGDTLLKDVGKRLSAVLRDFDSIARLGGDEFAILLHNVDLDGAIVVAEKISSTMDLPFQVETHQLLVGCSLGIALYPEHGESNVDLIKHAHVALHSAKRNRSKYGVYNALEDNSHVSHISLAADLKRAINNNELQLFYQPKVDSKSGKVIETEALLRWIHPVKGFIPPEQIVSAAEQSGLIHRLTEWVINTAISQTDRWQKNGVHIGVAVNLSAYNLQNPHLVTIVEYLLNDSVLEPNQLILEITESAMMLNPKLAAGVLSSLDNLGLRIAIDDFGTGYSSLAYLKNLPVHELKIDRSFVMNIVTDKSDFSIVKSTIDLAHNLGLSVVAEGVEDRESWDILDSLGCDLIQGYYVSKPIPPQDFEKWYREYSRNLL